MSSTGPETPAQTEARRAHDDTVAFRLDSAQRAKRAAEVARAMPRPVTPELLRTAFRTDAARTLLARARVARLAQDSSLTSYDASTYERFSLGLDLSRFMRERLLLRAERSTRVAWQRDRGAKITVTGVRSAVPIAGIDDNDDVHTNGPLFAPYAPGSDALWVGSGLAKTDVDAAGIINPLANGAEAYYTYATGDSLTLTLPTRAIVVRELRVVPRTPGPRVVIGSLWFESNGQLVRAIYRMAAAEPITTETDAGTDAGMLSKLLQRMLTPTMSAEITSITVDYGLFEGRFWLPTSQTGEGEVHVGSARVPAHLRQHFEYSGVNGTVDVPAISVTSADTAYTLDAYVKRQSLARRACADTSAQQAEATMLNSGTLPVVLQTPCNPRALAHSKSLPPSIYDPVDTLFDEQGRAELVDNTFRLRREVSFEPQKPVVHLGLGYTRYNRIEGFSTGAEVRQVYAPGFAGHLLVRGGVADRSVNGEIGLTRTNGPAALSLNAYRRLVAADDWGNPFGLAASLSALFGHDHETYYRTWGGEMIHLQESGLIHEWRLFGQQEFVADQRAEWTIGSAKFQPNARAVKGSVGGLALRRHDSFGENPSRLRAQSDLRFEGVAGTFDYVRGMLDLAFDQPVSSALRASLTVSGGTSGGTLPIQHHWFLGGANTVRGQPIGAAQGDAYWFTRMELGASQIGFKPMLFGDLGWAGDRDSVSTNVHPISGAGIGASILDGLIRFDLAKGIHPSRGVRLDAYFGGRF